MWHILHFRLPTYVALLASPADAVSRHRLADISTTLRVRDVLTILRNDLLLLVL